MSDQQASVQDARHPAVVIVIRGADGRVLFIERPAHETFPGYWNPVTGAMEEYDADLARTCQREAMEEVGLRIEVLRKVWESDTINARFRLHWFLARLDSDAQEVKPNPDEVSAWRWLDPMDLADVAPMFDDTRRFFAEIYPEAIAERQGRVMHDRVHVMFTGRVQGVFFRQTSVNIARGLGVTGWVRNLPDGRVELLAEGERPTLERLLASIGEAKRENIVSRNVSWETATEEFAGFDVR